MDRENKNVSFEVFRILRNAYTYYQIYVTNIRSVAYQRIYALKYHLFLYFCMMTHLYWRFVDIY